jgi:hypothetical protein
MVMPGDVVYLLISQAVFSMGSFNDYCLNQYFFADHHGHVDVEIRLIGDFRDAIIYSGRNTIFEGISSLLFINNAFVEGNKTLGNYFATPRT